MKVKYPWYLLKRYKLEKFLNSKKPTEVGFWEDIIVEKILRRLIGATSFYKGGHERCLLDDDFGVVSISLSILSTSDDVDAWYSSL